MKKTNLLSLGFAALTVFSLTSCTAKEITEDTAWANAAAAAEANAKKDTFSMTWSKETYYTQKVTSAQANLVEQNVTATGDISNAKINSSRNGYEEFAGVMNASIETTQNGTKSTNTYKYDVSLADGTETLVYTANGAEQTVSDYDGTYAKYIVNYLDSYTFSDADVPDFSLIAPHFETKNEYRDYSFSQKGKNTTVKQAFKEGVGADFISAAYGNSYDLTEGYINDYKYELTFNNEGKSISETYVYSITLVYTQDEVSYTITNTAKSNFTISFK